MNNVSTLGIDLAKNVFQLHGTGSKGKTVLKNACRAIMCIFYVMDSDFMVHCHHYR